jgi:hypothetical protein
MVKSFTKLDLQGTDVHGFTSRFYPDAAAAVMNE